MFDTHCHLTFPEFEGRVGDVLAEAEAAGVRGCITVSTTSDDALKAQNLAEAHENVWFTAGAHPLYSDKDVDWDVLRKVGENPKCVAWGELGLDNHYNEPPRKFQDKVLTDFLAVIESQGKKPIVVHCRDAVDELLAIFKATSLDPARFVFHCFNSGPEDAKKILDFGAWISFTGIVTFANASEVAKAAKIVPADRIMVETDSPFLSPEPVRKMRPNEPKNVVHVARKIAEFRGIDPGEFEQQLDSNAKTFFGL